LELKKKDLSAIKDVTIPSLVKEKFTNPKIEILHEVFASRSDPKH